MSLEDIYKILELDGKDALIRLSDKKWKEKISFPSRIYRLFVDKGNVLSELKAFFYFNNKPLILFYENPTCKLELHKAIWNFNESPIVIIAQEDNVEIFNGFSFDANTKLLESLGDKENLSCFKYFELVTGKSWEKYKNNFEYSNRVDYHLLKNIEAAQYRLRSFSIDRNIANLILGKVIFIRYLIDRKVKLNFENISKYWTNKDVINLFSNKDRVWSFFYYLQDSENGFNGDLFRIDKDEFDLIDAKCFDVIIRLLSCEEIETGQRSLFDIYDFSILPVEFISNVYEKFIGKENQENKSAYYTPTFLVDYIIKQTVSEKIERDNTYNCKILDPSCGSGIFLVESLRKIIDKYIEINHIKDSDRNSQDFKNALKRLVKNNIFGIDSDESAIQVAMFSIYLTLLDYQKPADIENFKFPNLLKSNFICGDTFEVNTNIFGGIKFDYIIGNPPWKRGRIETNTNDLRIRHPYEKYIEKKAKREGFKKIIANNEIAQAFIVRSMDFASEKTKCALIVTSKTLYNVQSEIFRKYILDKLYLDKIFELAPVRREVFNKSNDKAIAPACILFYRNAFGKPTNENIITHIALKPNKFFSLFKVFSLSKTDVQKIRQDRLKEYDWLWKVLVYGSYLDFNFIKRLKEKKTIENISNYNKFVVGQGIIVGGERSNYNKDASSLMGKKFLDSKDVCQYYVNDTNKTWGKKLVHRIRNLVLYKAPLLVITKSTTNDLRSKAALCEEDVVYKDAITGIHSENKDILRNMIGTLNSSFFSYYSLLTFSSLGIEREQAFIKEKFSVPYCDDIYKYVLRIEQLTKLAKKEVFNLQYQKQIKEEQNTIDKTIYKKFQCSEQELDLIDYAKTITIPLIIRHKVNEVNEIITKENNILKNYITVFFDRFKPSFDTEGHVMIAEVHYTKQFIGIFFKIILKKNYVQDIVFLQDNDKIISFLIKVSSNKITDKLFVQKDIRGFDKDAFYIFKPNEKRLWHKAIAHLDVNEFADAILQVGGGNNE